MLSEMGVRSMVGRGGGGGDGFAGEELEKELALLLREQKRQEASDDLGRELNVYRSGSAPPTVEGSLAAMGRIVGSDIASGVDFSGHMNANEFPTEEELLSSPSYLSYYYSHGNLNPRLPPPVLSKEDWRSAQRLQVGRTSDWAGVSDWREMSRGEEGAGASVFLQQPGFNAFEEHMPEGRKAPVSGEWLDEGDGLIGLSLGMQKSFAGVLQEDLGGKTLISSYPACPEGINTFVNGFELLSSADMQPALNNEVASLDGELPGEYVRSANGVQNVGASMSHTFASVEGSSVGRSTTDVHLNARAPSLYLPPIGVRISSTNKKDTNCLSSFSGVSSGTVETDDLIGALSGISLSTVGSIADDRMSRSNLQKGFDDKQNFIFPFESAQNISKTHQVLKSYDTEYLNMASIPQSMKSSYSDSTKSSGSQMGLQNVASKLNGPLGAQWSTIPPANLYLKESLQPSVANPGGSPVYFQNLDSIDTAFAGYGQNANSISPILPSMLENHIGRETLPYMSKGSIASLDNDSRALGSNVFAPPNFVGPASLQALNRVSNQAAASALQSSLSDPLFVQYLKAAEYTAQVAANYGDTSLNRGSMANSYSDLVGIQKAYLGLLQQHKQYDMSLSGKSGSLSQNHYGNPAFGEALSYPASPLVSPVASPIGPGSPLRLGERSMRLPLNLRNISGGGFGSWHAESTPNMDEHFPSTLLEELKSNKSRCFELAAIAGHVVEFSADQYGSRFIQQKLEMATTEEKDMVFEEIKPHALSLMTDVFGNYVVQKFFEHGSTAQRRELTKQINGHVLALSLQMYGCRVIQKAIEVVDLDQKIKMVLELDGHVMRCVRDQNGNHVIQKCIECVPQEAIHFIISTFYDQVVALSTHPYGCRVIQRVLEHCDDPKTQHIMMDEILRSVCMLAQDQYGNYVVQHVLEHGKHHERSVIIKKLAGQIVQMSQQKFASNVVEKCLTFGDLEERQLLVNEMLGSTDENEPLQAMMKDQFANYVVQKVLEICDDQQRELILSRIKVHLNALKKYTYGKHIVARVEKLVAAGERRIGLQFS